MSTLPSHSSSTISAKIKHLLPEIYVASSLTVVAEILLKVFLYEPLKEHYGESLGLVILISALLLIVIFFWLVRLIRYIFKNFVVEPLILELKSKIELPNQKIGRLRDKYKGVNFAPISLSKDYESVDECREVKIELIKGVQRSVYAIHLVEKFLPLPLESNDDEQYFDGNIKALDRMLSNRSNDNSDAADEDDAYGIYRIFIISQDALNAHEKRHEIADRIKRHAERFNVLVVKKEELMSPPNYEFAIYDDDIAFYLSVDLIKGVYGEGTIYLDDAVIQGVYKKRFRTIKGLACSPEKFWGKPVNAIKP